MKISVLIPAFNEAQVLPLLKQRLEHLATSLPAYEFQFLFVDDGSRDSTRQYIRDWATADNRVSLVGLSRNFGKESAMLAGFDAVTGDAVVIIDADLQDPPELIPDMIAKWQEGYDDVYAKRTSRAGETWMKKFTSRMYYKVLQSVTDIEIQRDTGDFRLLSRRCLNALRQLRERERNTKGLFSWVGFKKIEIEYERDARAAGSTKWGYFKLLRLAIDGITSFTTAPLRFSTISGLLVSFGAFVYLLVILIQTWIFGVRLDGYPSMMAVILFLGGIQLISIGVIGEYIGRIFVESKRRPVYLVDETVGVTLEDLEDAADSSSDAETNRPNTTSSAN